MVLDAVVVVVVVVVAAAAAAAAAARKNTDSSESSFRAEAPRALVSGLRRQITEIDIIAWIKVVQY